MDETQIEEVLKILWGLKWAALLWGLSYLGIVCMLGWWWFVLGWWNRNK